jgi:Tfp pilus assembly protein PilX
MKNFKRQQGATLITSLIMLIVLTLLVISAIRSSTTNLRIAGNMQMQAEAIAVAQLATEQFISNNFTAPSFNSAVSIIADINNDGNRDFTASVTSAKCISNTPVLSSSIDYTKASDASCMPSSKKVNTEIIYVSAPLSGPPTTSLCVQQLWDITATASSIDGTVNIKTHQGISLRVAKETGC